MTEHLNVQKAHTIADSLKRTMLETGGHVTQRGSAIREERPEVLQYRQEHLYSPRREDHNPNADSSSVDSNVMMGESNTLNDKKIQQNELMSLKTIEPKFSKKHRIMKRGNQLIGSAVPREEEKTEMHTSSVQIIRNPEPTTRTSQGSQAINSATRSITYRFIHRDTLRGKIRISIMSDNEYWINGSVVDLLLK